jgi:hypothetical protein
MSFVGCRVKIFEKGEFPCLRRRKKKDSKCWCKRERKEEHVLIVRPLDGTNCTNMFDVNAHGMFGVGVNIRKWSKQEKMKSM